MSEIATIASKFTVDTPVTNDEGDTVYFNMSNIFTISNPTIIAKIPGSKPRNNQFILVPKYMENFEPTYGHEFNDTQQTYTIKSGEQYFVFVPRAYMNLDYTYFLIYTEDGVPMREFSEVAPNLYLIPILDGRNPYIPFRRYSSSSTSFKIGFQGQVMAYEDGTILYSQGKNSNTCLLSSIPSAVVVKKDMISKIGVYSSNPSSTNEYKIIKQTKCFRIFKRAQKILNVFDLFFYFEKKNNRK